MLCSAPTGTEISRGVDEVIKRSELRCRIHRNRGRQVPTRWALDRSGYGGSGLRDLKFVRADRFFRSVSVSVSLVLDSGWVNMPVCTQGCDCDVHSRFLSEGVDQNMFWFCLGQFGFPLPVMGCSARKYDMLAWVHGLSVWVCC